MATYEAKRYDFSGANITALNGSNVASGTVAAARIADLATSKITSGTFADARISSGSVTQHVSATTQVEGTWTPGTNVGGFTGTTGLYSRTGNIVNAIAYGYWNSRTSSTDTTHFTMSGLPITSRNAGSSVGSGVGSFHNQRGYQLGISVVSNSTTAKFYTTGFSLSTSNYYNSNNLYSTLADSTASGYKITGRNLHESSATNVDHYFYVQFVYMV